MSRNYRLAAIFLSAVAALLAAVVLYLAFGDLGRHKGRIEALVTELIGRSFAIDGAFELEVLPSITVVAERVRVGNADWGSQPQMVELGRLSARIGLWSLVSGPVDVRSLEVSDLSVLLETVPDGKGNWVFGDAGAPEEAEAPDSSAAAAPPVLQNAKLGNLRITYRERGKPDRVALIETLSIGPGSAGLLALSGKGSLNELPATVSGELGPLDALFSGQNIRMAIQASLGDLPKEAERKFDARVHLALAEVRLGTTVLRDVDSTLLLEGGRLNLEGRVRDSLEGTLGGTTKLTSADGGAVALDISISAKNVRANLGAGDAIDPKDAPPTNVEARLLARGASARQMASGADGRVVVTQAPGKLPSGVLGLIGGDLLRELVGKLNPFATQDPYTQLECAVVRADIVDGQVTVNPVLMQSAKVTIVAGGKIDLGTEALRFDFNTRPRTGVGISAGMFTNPFIELVGTLASPRLGVGAKGTAAAAATGGLSVLAQGLMDRARGGQDMCKKTLEETAAKAK